MPTIFIPIFAFSGLIIGIASLSLGFLVFYKNRRSHLHIVFFFMTIAIAGWSLAYWRWLSVDIHDQALFWIRILSIGSTLIPVLHLHWILTLVGEVKKKWKILIPSYLLTFVLLGFTFSSLFIRDVGPTFGFPFWPKPGILYHFYVVFCYIGMLTYGLSRLFVGYRRLTGHKRQQIRYVFLGLSLAAIGGFTNFPLWYNINIPPYGNPFVLAYVVAYTYAIIKHRLMDIRIVIKQGTVYLMSLAVVVGMAVVGVWGMARAAERAVSSWVLIGGALGLAFGLLIFDPIKRVFQKIANKYLFVSLYNYQEAVRSLSHKLTTSIELNRVIDSIIKIAMDTMKLDKAGVLLRDKKSKLYQIQEIIGFKEENGISLVKDSFLTDYLQKSQKPLVYEELALEIRDSTDPNLKEQLNSLRQNMKRIEAAICLPLFQEKKLQGLIVLGNKISSDAYSIQDLELLETLANQASIAIENARLYREVRDLTDHLQEKVDEQTRHIKKLFEMKTEFLHLVSHQLRTPLTALRGLLSMWAEGTFDDYPQEEKQKIKQRIQLSCERLNNITNDMLDTLDIEEGYARFTFEPLDLVKSIKEILEMLRPNFEKKGLYLKLNKPKKPLPKIQADKRYLPQALQNIIDNAEKYTEQGGLVINLSQPDSGHIKISLKDTGIGMISEEQARLFKEKFFRGKRADKMYTAGTGLGLYIVKHIIEGHHGKIEVRSQGEGKGSEFIVILPIVQSD